MDEPEFGIRMLGYSRGEVDEFVAEVRAQLRCLGSRAAEPSGAVRVIAPGRRPEPVPAEEDAGDGPRAQLKRLMRYAEEEATARTSEARTQAERTLRGARELADQIVGESRRRAAELDQQAQRRAAELDAEAQRRARDLEEESRRRTAEVEERVLQALDREVRARVAELAEVHARLARDLVAMREGLNAALVADEALGEIDVRAYSALIPGQRG